MVSLVPFSKLFVSFAVVDNYSINAVRIMSSLWVRNGCSREVTKIFEHCYDVDDFMHRITSHYGLGRGSKLSLLTNEGILIERDTLMKDLGENGRTLSAALIVCQLGQENQIKEQLLAGMAHKEEFEMIDGR